MTSYIIEIEKLFVDLESSLAFLIEMILLNCLIFSSIVFYYELYFTNKWSITNTHAR